MSRTFHPVVAVPVRDEAHRLPLLLHALDRQTWTGDVARDPLDVLLVLNNCTDDSAGVVGRLVPHLHRLTVTVVSCRFADSRAHVGSARRLAMNLARERLGNDPLGVILTTDADAVPDPGWVAANLRAFAKGADLVGGCLDPDPAEVRRLAPAVVERDRRQRRYGMLVSTLDHLLDPGSTSRPHHGDHTGASLAVSARVYDALDGMPALPFREDVTFVERARLGGYRLDQPADVRVRVSARQTGRARGGMADCLADWSAAERVGAPHLVEPPALVVARIRRRLATRSAIPSPSAATAPEEAAGLSVRDVAASGICIESAIAEITAMIAGLESPVSCASEE